MDEVGPEDEQLLEQQIAALVRDVLQIEVTSSDDDLIAGGMLDSLGVVTLIAELEVDLGQELLLDEFDIESFRTVRRIAAFVIDSRQTQGAA
ncbi:MAG TPA: phosphopantetheine-binding protein [Acidimicrobiales bacterium]|nr:phosphopantetheine-binding protein [Acidimicrobiales bacterium]